MVPNHFWRQKCRWLESPGVPGHIQENLMAVRRRRSGFSFYFRGDFN